MTGALFDIWIYFALMVALSSVAGCRLVRWFPWSKEAQAAYLDRFTGLALAPLLIGVVAIIALLIFPKATHGTHIIAIAVMLSGIALVGGVGGKAPVALCRPTHLSRTEYACVLLLCGAAFWLITDALIIPLTQNDALEYTTVGRELYLARTLDAYPLLNPETNASGFYGPWTHPPLYVVLIYVTHLLQGNADAPTLMRLIAPWCALVATGLVFALGKLENRRAALLGAVMFLLTPLFFLGADSGLIDALPVLGSALMLALLMGLSGRALWVGAVQGFVIGLALWTHSQAILLLPLMAAGIVLRHGITRWRIIIPQMMAVLVLACLIAIWPYLRNLELFGAFISDTPKVFALEQLNWKDYFAYNRGITSLTAKIQYGLFKGLSAVEAYSIIFWLMLCGIVYYFRRFLPLRNVWRVWMDGQIMPEPRVIYCAIFLSGVYLSGVLASIIVGVDLMIRNERYMLMMLPMAALIGSWFVNQLLTYLEYSRRRFVRIALIGVMSIGILIFAGQLLVLMAYRFSVHEISWRDLLEANETILLRQPGYGSIQYLRNQTETDSLVLSLRPADMYYAKRRMISYLDPRLLPFYSEKDPVKGLQILKDLGIQYVQVSDYFLPPAYNSTLMEILARPDLSSLVYNNIDPQTFLRGRMYHEDLVMDMFQKNLFNHLYALTPEKNLRRTKSEIFAPPHYPWMKFQNWVIGGRKPILNISNGVRDFRGPISTLELPLKLFQRERMDAIALGNAKALLQRHTPTDLLHVSEHKKYVLDVMLKGNGNVTFWVIQYDGNGQALRYENSSDAGEKVMIGDFVLSKASPQKQFLRRIPMLPHARYLQIGIEHLGNSWIEIKHAELITYEHK
jgi:hypothetical protein